MISKEGEIKFEIALSDKGGLYVTTKEIVATVRKGYGDGDVDAENTTPVLSTLLNAASACVVAAKTAEEIAENAEAAAETARKAAENAETAAENAKITVDDAFDLESTNPVQNKVAALAIDENRSAIILLNEGQKTNTNQITTLLTRIEYTDIDVYNLKVQLGDIETASDNIISIQNALIGGDSV